MPFALYELKVLLATVLSQVRPSKAPRLLSFFSRSSGRPAGSRSTANSSPRPTAVRPHRDPSGTHSRPAHPDANRRTRRPPCLAGGRQNQETRKADWRRRSDSPSAGSGSHGDSAPAKASILRAGRFGRFLSPKLERGMLFPSLALRAQKDPPPAISTRGE